MKSVLMALMLTHISVAPAQPAPPATDDEVICVLVIPAIVVDVIASYRKGLTAEEATEHAAALSFPNLRPSVRPYVPPLAANLPGTLYINRMIGKVSDAELIQWHIDGCLDADIGDAESDD